MSDETNPTPRPTKRDFGAFSNRLTSWLTGRLGPGSDPHVTNLVVPDANGMSSETVLFDVVHQAKFKTSPLACVARLEPEPSSMPVFPSYDFAKQVAAMRAVARHTSVPVPEVHWFEADSAAVGSPMVVMERIEGDVPPDVMPYNFGSWLSEASTDDQRRLQDETVELVAQVHSLAPDVIDLGFAAGEGEGSSPLRRHVDTQVRYFTWLAAGRPYPLIERSFAWLFAHWPSHEPASVLSWGDARIGNVLYRDFVPVGALDWEMVGVAPPEVDVTWLVFLHRFFEDIAHQMDLPGMPSFLRLGDVVATYEHVTGTELVDLDWYLVYAALRHALVMSRVQERMARDAGQPYPDDPDDLIMHRVVLEGMLE